MQVLEAFDNVRWLVSREETHLPEPAATRSRIRVEVRGLRNRSLVSPGRITGVVGTGGTLPDGLQLDTSTGEIDIWIGQADLTGADGVEREVVHRPSGQRPGLGVHSSPSSDSSTGAAPGTTRARSSSIRAITVV